MGPGGLRIERRQGSRGTPPSCQCRFAAGGSRPSGCRGVRGGDGDRAPEAGPEESEVPVGLGEWDEHGGGDGQADQEAEDAEEPVGAGREPHQQPEDEEHATAEHDHQRLPEAAVEGVAEVVETDAEEAPAADVVVLQPVQQQADAGGDAREDRAGGRPRLSGPRKATGRSSYGGVVASGPPKAVGPPAGPDATTPPYDDRPVTLAGEPGRPPAR